MNRVLSPGQIWGIPVLLGVLSLVGLVAALVADGLGDALSWLALAVPSAVSLWGFRRQTPRTTTTTSPERKAVRPAPPPRA